MIKPGECFETGFWMTGSESEPQITACCRDMEAAFKKLALDAGVIIAPAIFTIKVPGDERVPEVPHHVRGHCVTLLVGEARIVGWAPQASPAGSFVQDLDLIDRARLRAITRRAHKNAHPSAARLSDADCDRMAEQIGPESAGRAIREYAESKAVH